MFRDLAKSKLKPERELSRREQDLENSERVKKRLTKVQRDLLDDPYDMKAALVPRRGGKSCAAAAAILCTSLENQGGSCYFAALSRARAKAIIWGELKKLDQEFGLGCKFKEFELVCVLPNKSHIYLVGVETIAEVEKLRGVWFNLFIVDESKSISARVLKYLIDEVVEPGLGDYEGQLWLIGTPGTNLNGPFFEATAPELVIEMAESSGKKVEPHALARHWRDRDKWKGREYAWSLHTWSVEENTAMPHLWDKALRRKRMKGWSDENPIWQREYLGKWVVDNSEKVYRFDPFKNTWEPKGKFWEESLDISMAPWRFTLGLDIGFDDPTTVNVLAYSDYCPDVFQVYEFKKSEMTSDDILALLRQLEERFGDFDAKVGDHNGGGSRIIFKTWEENEGMIVDAAEKNAKREYIEIVNSEMLEGRIKIARDGLLAEEMAALPKAATKAWEAGKYDVPRGARDDLCDSFLYAWRSCRHRLSEEREIAPSPGTHAFVQQKEQEEIEKLEKRVKSDENDDWQTFVISDIDNEDLDEIDREISRIKDHDNW